MREAMYWEPVGGGAVRCGLCPHRCRIAEDAIGICGVRENRGGTLLASGYGQVSSIALDPIEKKPLYMFQPGKRVLSIGGFGCNLRCPFCQNHEISMVYVDRAENPDNQEYTENKGNKGNKEIEKPDNKEVAISENPNRGSTMSERASKAGAGRRRRTRADEGARRLSPDEIADLAVRTVPDGNIGIAYTYNEPLIGYEFLSDCAALVRGAGMCNVVVTNGFINSEPLERLLPFVDAMNIDLKGLSKVFYRKLGGNPETVKETIVLAHRHCHVEVTTLIIPDENEDDVAGLAQWLSSIDPAIPLHLSRFFPRYLYSDRYPTPGETVYRLRDTARKFLKNVFIGNM